MTLYKCENFNDLKKFSSMLRMDYQSMAANSYGVGKTYRVTNTTTDYTGQCKYCPKENKTKCKLQGRPPSTIECNWWDSGCCGRPLLNPSPPIMRECQEGDIDQSFPATATPLYNCGHCRYGCKSRCDFLVTAVAREMCSFMRHDGEEIYVCNCCCRDIQ
ncbi:hypothetical protein MKX01_016516 [Papaver californicum]|nr:hypothetical protein MKX01_016516 [Papaver californicum]